MGWNYIAMTALCILRLPVQWILNRAMYGTAESHGRIRTFWHNRRRRLWHTLMPLNASLEALSADSQ
jgi:hypothetical protein